MKTRFILFFLFLSFNFLFSQKLLEGFVLDSLKKPLNNIKVEIPKLKLYNYTDISGKFVFNLTELNNIIIQIKDKNYNDYKKEYNLNEIKQAIEIIISKKSEINITRELDNVFVNSTRHILKASNSFENIDKKEIKQKNYSQDIPILLENTISAVSTSDAGTGIGYTGLKIRGVDPSRTNVTINGIPINDPESHAVYWVNMPDIVSSAENIEIQRGSGTSSNGAGAFGASISFQTNKYSKKPYSLIDNSYGSFNTSKNSVFASTGLIDKNFQVDIRLSKIKSDGFIDRAKADLKSYYLQISKLENRWTMKILVFGGKEITYQAWNGIPEAKLRGNKEDLLKHFYNNYYLGGIYQNKEDSINLFSSNNRTYNYYTYKNEVDNYQQHHAQLLNSFQISKNLKTNISFHYTRGLGYYEQFKYRDDFSKYNLEAIDTGSSSITNGDFIRRKYLDNHFYGLVYSLEYDNKKNFNIIFGSSANQYIGSHYGELVWAQYASNSNLGTKYYENDAIKNDYNFYLKALYYYKKISLYTDFQLRSLNYSFMGIDENNGIIEEKRQKVDFLFFNPKFGISYQISNFINLYSSYSMAQREPVRDDFRENLNKNRPKSETLHDTEIGLSFEKKILKLKLNYYFMYYNNQLILTGKINDVGSYTRINVPYSYRSGIEFEGKLALFKEKLNIKLNTTLSKNKIIKFVEYIDDYDKGGQIEIEHKKSDLSFSPSTISSLQVSYNFLRNFNIIWTSKYIGKQYLDNTQSSDRVINSYNFSNLYFYYTKENFITKEITLGFQINNILNQKYENNGYTWGYIYGGQRIIENYYFPQAGTNIMIRLSLVL